MPSRKLRDFASFVFRSRLCCPLFELQWQHHSFCVSYSFCLRVRREADIFHPLGHPTDACWQPGLRLARAKPGALNPSCISPQWLAGFPMTRTLTYCLSGCVLAGGSQQECSWSSGRVLGIPSGDQAAVPHTFPAVLSCCGSSVWLCQIFRSSISHHAPHNLRFPNSATPPGSLELSAWLKEGAGCS